MKVIILGGGMVGMLAKFLFPDAIVLDWRRIVPKGPMNGAKQFGAQYLWEPLTGIPCRSFTVSTTIDGKPPTFESAVAYKHKIGKPEDVKDGWMRQFESPTTGWAMEELPGVNQADVIWGSYIANIDLKSRIVYTRHGAHYPYSILISTIPLPSLLDMVGPHHLWRSAIWAKEPVAVRETIIPPDIPPLPKDYVRVDYLTDPDTPIYRMTDREGMRHYEWLKYKTNHFVGIPTKVIKPGKIWPNPFAAQIQAYLGRFGICCAGRFGQWEPDQLLHQTFHYLQQLRGSI